MMTSTSHPTDIPHNDSVQREAPPAADVAQELEDLLSLGRMWARYGLDAGSRALEASARTLAVTSSLLSKLGAEIHPEGPTPAAADAPERA